MMGWHRLKRNSKQLRPCAHCGFWMTPQQVYCPNCNHTRPFSLAFLPFKLVLFSTGTLGILTLFHSLELGVTWPHFGVGLAEGLGVTGGLLATVWVGSQRLLGRSLLPHKPSSCLQQGETRIHDRLQYLHDRQQPIDQVRQRATHIRDLQRREAILQALDHAVELLHNQVDQYRLKLWEIALLRWHNQVQPLLQTHTFQTQFLQASPAKFWQRLWFAPPASSVEITDALEALEEILTTGQALLVDWEHHPLGDRRAGETLVERLEQALNSSDRLYQDLVALQASAVLQGLSHFELDAQLKGQTSDVEEMIEAFGALPSVYDFAQGFDALEQEYLRLQGELEVRQLTS